MSVYGHKTFTSKFSIRKYLVEVGNSDRFSSAKPSFSYKALDGSQVDMVTHPSGVYIVKPEDADLVVVRLLGVTPTTVFSNVEIVDTAESYSLAANKNAVVLEGSLANGSDVVDANVAIGMFEGGSDGKVLMGTGKLITFDYTL